MFSSEVGLIGDVETGKTSLMVKYVEGIFDQDYIETLGKKFFIQIGNFGKVSVEKPNALQRGANDANFPLYKRKKLKRKNKKIQTTFHFFFWVVRKSST